MQRGSVIADRFTVEREAGAGGMGTVYRAIDRWDGEPVAVKILRGASPHLAERFLNEARLLAELSHPGIVRYLAHGTMGPPGDLYLAMEWLEGEDLSARLLREPLAVADAMLMAQKVAAALGAAHTRGVVHRDVKPSNIFLVGGSVEQVKVLDFGIARPAGLRSPLTGTGAVIGTPGYMAPEQARGLRRIDARADVFSLGCVLFECLTGQPPFCAENVVAVLAKILLEDPPRLSALRPDLPRVFDTLMSRLLAKSPHDRLPDGAAVVAALDDLERDAGTLARFAPAFAAPAPDEVTTEEKRLISVLLVGGIHPGAERPAGAGWAEPTVSMQDEIADLTGCRSIASEFGARIEPLFDGTLVACLMGRGAATDQAAQAARLAIALRTVVGDRAQALGTGLGQVADRWPVGEVIDRAFALVQDGAPRGAILVDELTAGLLDSRFAVDAEPGTGRFLLRGERPDGEPRRTLLGRPSPCVGRERDLHLLEELVAEAVEERAPRAALITAPPGTGKTRLRQELVTRLRGQGDLTLWLGRGDPFRTGTPFAMLAEALRGAAGIAAADGPDERHRKLRARLSRHLRGETLQHALSFLGQLLGAPPPTPDASLLAARDDAQRMGAEVVDAWETLIAAESKHTPLVIVLDDLHWGDHATIKLLDEAMRDPARPLAVLAFARPEVRELFPGLFAERGVLEVRLMPLGRRAAEKLVREMLGEVDDETVRRIVERAAGNAFFLEELIRAVAEGRGDALPDTVLAMAHARIEGFESEARRVLRAASIFGETFWRTGVTSLLGTSGRSLAVADWLDLLCEREMITRRSDARFAGEEEYAFRHALVREAAYATLPDEDRRRGHRIAGEWLGAVGERDAVVLGQHFERGGDFERAIRWYHKAAQQAQEGLDPVQAVAWAEKAIALGASDAALGSLQVILCEAQHSRGDFVEAERRAMAALALVERFSPAWYRAATIVFALAAFGNVAHLFEVVAMVEADQAGGEPSVARQQTWSIAAAMLFAIGQVDRACAFVARVEADAEAAALKNPLAEVWLRVARMYLALYVERSPGGFLAEVSAALAVIARIGDTLADAWLRVEWAGGLIATGDIERGVAVVEEMLTNIQASAVLRASLLHYLARGYGLLHRLDEALEVQEEALAASRAQKGIVYVALGLVHRSRLMLQKGDAQAARRDAAEASELLTFVPTVRPAAQAAEAAAALALGRADEALTLAREAHAAFAAFGMIGDAETAVRLVLAEALEATGDAAAARQAIAEARDRVLARAATLGDERLAQAFLARLPDNARTLALAEAWLAGEGGEADVRAAKVESEGGSGPATAPA